MLYYEKLDDKENILVEIWSGGPITSEDAAWLCLISKSHASNILRHLWVDNYVKRKKVKLVSGGLKYEYKITKKGSDLAEAIYMVSRFGYISCQMNLARRV